MSIRHAAVPDLVSGQPSTDQEQTMPKLSPDPTSYSELGGFLRTRRAELTPEEVGLPSYGSRRRVPGLRREELALLAGVSVTHYTRLEQGRADSVSDSVLDAIARTLRLSDDERAHLQDLARPVTDRGNKVRHTETAPPSVIQLLDAMTEVPAVVLNRCNDILAWNRLGHLLLAGHLPADSPVRSTRRPNLTEILFLSREAQTLYPRWEEEARLAVASLRLTAGRYPDDRRLKELIGELAVRSDKFAALWASHVVRTCVEGVKHIDHPQAGVMELSFQSLSIPGSADQRVIAYTAEPGSPSEGALRRLASTGSVGPPLPAHQPAVPGQQGAGGDQTMPTQPRRQPPGESSEHGALRPGQPRADTELPTQHGNLVAQGEQLYVHGPVGTGEK
ncbi:helix-turn-helix transcriptional regulator [Peterkaempfera sp. SMS 1(5)a]|uniref:helix-turn-helix transcriptional regulator n=1 Tax=Peterkaempfera podocarpi TaxID=3232308 RepID=UPI00366D2343